ncbi:competence type IV pilus minor pilin ComGF [Salimicrobium flavidum]|uniref:Competence protein ComGF n=1 Tax=Salimicrobium flavidum TaxID=570947 RepID=A0A1N7IIU7_9BACI|nr:competence type IV pilus minor pilin ComGF [Salimicrobium flavidum]SIS36911.1 competence protein ComGF [Salimicrobium flavidum]
MKSVFMIEHGKGFTLAEVLLSLTVLMTTLIILVPLMYHLRPEDWNEDWSHHQFVYLIQEELNTASSIEAGGNVLSLINSENETITIEKYQNMVRRRVSGRGHEVWLYNVNSIDFSYTFGEVQTEIVFKGGGRFDKIFFIPEK